MSIISIQLNIGLKKLGNGNKNNIYIYSHNFYLNIGSNLIK